MMRDVFSNADMSKYATNEIIRRWRRFFNAPDMTVQDIAEMLSVELDGETADIQEALTFGMSRKPNLYVQSLELLSELEQASGFEDAINFEVL